jgi:hypothetical protein
MCTHTHMSGATIKVIASEKTWIEDDALQQLKTTAQLPGMRQVVGLPDLHVGRGYPGFIPSWLEMISIAERGFGRLIYWFTN